MSVLPQLEDELLAAHRRLRARGRLTLIMRRRTGNLFVAGAALAAIAVAAFVLTAVRHHPAQPHPTRPSIGSSPPPVSSGPVLPSNPTRRQLKEESYLRSALVAVANRDRGCEMVSRSGGRPGSVSEGSPSQSLLSILAVLRRPARPTDRLPVRITYHPYQRDPTGSLPPLKGIYVRYIRRARWRFGAGYYLIPAADANPLRPLPQRCYAQQQAALRRELPHIPSSLRAGTLALEPRYLNQLKLNAAQREGVCLAALNDTGNGDSCGGGFTLSAIEEGHTLASGGPTGVGVVYGVVPDGVATVTLLYHGRRSQTVPAINNVFILRNPGQRLPQNGFPDKMIWRSAQGTIIKTIAEP